VAQAASVLQIAPAVAEPGAVEPRQPVEIVVAGHYCHDTLVGKEGAVHRVLGGSAAYAASMLRSLGVRFRVIAKVGEDFLYGDEVAAKPLVLAGVRTTSFVDDYTGVERIQTCHPSCDPILPGDVDGDADVAIACAIAGEVPPATLLELRRRNRVLLADAQGLIRSFGPAGQVTNLPLRETPFADSLASIDYLKISAEEARGSDLAWLARRTRVVVTEGKHGCTLYGGGAPLHVDGVPAQERDSTGAGDCFLAGFGAGLARRMPIEAALKLGNLCGALAVESVGVPRISPAELTARSRREGVSLA
jgi:1D-myo-inositol 3-kinase